ncbi:MAG: hydroxyethylthiazole kinase [Bacteroidota bacterium]
MQQDLVSLWERVREQSPLVHNITNYVVMNTTANALLAVGASPVMAHAEEEVVDMVNIASSLVINIGTLSPRWVSAMKLAMARAKQLEKPIVLDPVGAGATPYRNQVLQELLEIATPSVIRGNASEVMALVATQRQTKGVDSTDSSLDAIEAGKFLVSKLHCTVCISGAVDIILAPSHQVHLKNGDPLMAKVTGMGCTATALIGAFCGVTDDTFLATTAAMAVLGVTGELAAKEAQGPGSMQLRLLDHLYSMEPSALTEYLSLTHV